MFYVLSKIVYFLISPSHLCLIALASGTILAAWPKRQRISRILIVASLTGFLVLGFSPLGSALMLPLEERFPPPKNVTAGDYTGIIMLGGFEDGNISRARQTMALIDAGERLSETVRLARMLPATRVVFTGGAGQILLEASDAGAAVKDYLIAVGTDERRIVVENRSRNTWENAVLTKDLLKPKPQDRFLLVTSAWHMPRAIGVFRKAGYDVVAYPVDFRTSGPEDLWRPNYSIYNGLERVDQATKEWLGLLVYWLSGRSSGLFPAP
ncbi:MAG: YdcF family protein [Hyphomicrobiaceae bacterium]